MKLFFGLMDKINPSGSLSFSRETSVVSRKPWGAVDGKRRNDFVRFQRKRGRYDHHKEKEWCRRAGEEEDTEEEEQTKERIIINRFLCVFGGIERRHFLPSFFLFTKQHFYYTQHKLTDKNTLTPILLKPEQQQNHTQEEE